MEIVDRLLQLVATPSVSGSERAIADLVESLVAGARPRWNRRRMGNNLVVGPVRSPQTPAAARDRRPLVAFVGHLDTVPPQGNEVPVLKDGEVWGRGAVDMKAGVAVMCDLVEHLDESALGVDLLLVFYDNEEVGYDRNGLGVVLRDEPALREIDLAFVLEPTALALEIGCNGHLNAEVVFRGRSAHSARPWLGVNAIHAAGPFISRIAGIPMREVTIGGATYRETISVTTARGGIARNIVPDALEITVNHRFPPDRTIEEAVGYVASLVPEGADHRIIDVAPPGGVPARNPLYDAFRARFRPEIRGKQGWTDVGRLSAAGIDAVNFGPGAPELSHRQDEHVPIDQLRRCRDILREFIIKA